MTEVPERPKIFRRLASREVERQLRRLQDMASIHE